MEDYTDEMRGFIDKMNQGEAPAIIWEIVTNAALDTFNQHKPAREIKKLGRSSDDKVNLVIHNSDAADDLVDYLQDRDIGYIDKINKYYYYVVSVDDLVKADPRIYAPIARAKALKRAVDELSRYGITAEFM